jgi:hypothetical protein
MPVCQTLVQPTVRASILTVEWVVPCQAKVYILERLEGPSHHSTPVKMLVVPEEQLAVIVQPIRIVGGILWMDVRRMRRRKGVGEDRQPMYHFVRRGRERFTRFEVLVVKNVGGPEGERHANF